MPTYQYRCKECDHQLEVAQSFTDDPLTECPSCSGPLRKVYGSVGISFKGSGFYKTDSRNGGGAKKAGSKDAASKDAAGKGAGESSSTAPSSTEKTSTEKAAASTPSSSSSSD